MLLRRRLGLGYTASYGLPSDNCCVFLLFSFLFSCFPRSLFVLIVPLFPFLYFRLVLAWFSFLFLFQTSFLFLSFILPVYLLRFVLYSLSFLSILCVVLIFILFLNGVSFYLSFLPILLRVVLFPFSFLSSVSVPHVVLIFILFPLSCFPLFTLFVVSFPVFILHCTLSSLFIPFFLFPCFA